MRWTQTSRASRHFIYNQETLSESQACIRSLTISCQGVGEARLQHQKRPRNGRFFHEDRVRRVPQSNLAEYEAIITGDTSRDRVKQEKTKSYGQTALNKASGSLATKVAQPTERSLVEDFNNLSTSSGAAQSTAIWIRWGKACDSDKVADISIVKYSYAMKKVLQRERQSLNDNDRIFFEARYFF